MSLDTDKPYVLRVAELIYSKVVNIKKENILFNFDSYEINKNEKRHSIVIFRIEK